MGTGTIKKIVRDRGFGFISGSDGKEVFFHRSDLTDINFDTLQEGQNVEFSVEDGRKGPRAVGVKLTQ